MAQLATQACAPCKGEEGKLSAAEISTLMGELPEWKLEGSAITRKFTFKNFEQALSFTNKVGALAEAEGHHPDFTLGWGYVGLTLTTHDCDGLSRNDMIMAAKIDALTK